jgi:hypothetical protein
MKIKNRGTKFPGAGKRGAAGKKAAPSDHYPGKRRVYVKRSLEQLAGKVAVIASFPTLGKEICRLRFHKEEDIHKPRLALLPPTPSLSLLTQTNLSLHLSDPPQPTTKTPVTERAL